VKSEIQIEAVDKMELYEAIYKRRTVRKFLEKEVDFDAVKRILEAGNRAPTWNHNRNWSYIVLRTEEEKAYAFEHAKKIAEKFDAEKYLNAPRPYPTTLAQKMYAYAMPRQYTMLKDAPYVIIPVFKSKELNGEYVSKLNPFFTIWCVIENIFLAATAEGMACSMRIPLNEEHDIVKAKLKVPPTYMIPAFIGIGYADPNEKELEQNVANLEKQLHFGKWK
jgi:nitroreductase